MTSKQTKIIYSAIILVLLVIIGLLVITRQPKPQLNDSSNQPNIQPSANQSPATITNTEKNNSAQALEAWLTYTNKEHSFSIQYPSDAKVIPLEEIGTEAYMLSIKNTPDYEQGEYLSGQFNMQLFIYNDDSDCRRRMKNAKAVTIGNVNGYRGTGADGPYYGYRFVLCAVKEGIHYAVEVTESDQEGKIANQILDSFKFIN